MDDLEVSFEKGEEVLERLFAGGVFDDSVVSNCLVCFQGWLECDRYWWFGCFFMWGVNEDFVAVFLFWCDEGSLISGVVRWCLQRAFDRGCCVVDGHCDLIVGHFMVGCVV